MELSVQQLVRAAIRQVLVDRGRPVPSLADDQSLFADGVGLDSLDFAAVVVRLEQETGRDPFRAGRMPRLPRSVAELIAVYENG